MTDGIAGNGGPVMTDCTERQPAAPSDGLAGEGREGMPQEAQA